MKNIISKAIVSGVVAVAAAMSGIQSAEAARLYGFESKSGNLSGHIQFDDSAERLDITSGVFVDIFIDAVDSFSIENPFTAEVNDLNLLLANRLKFGKDSFSLFDGLDEIATFTFKNAFQFGAKDSYETLLDSLDGAKATMTSSEIKGFKRKVTFTEKEVQVPEPAAMLGLGTVAAGLLVQKRSQKETA